MGHLSISGSKMSKSLKNLTTIREALSKGTWTARSLGIIFLLGGWREGIEITEDLTKAGSAWEDKLDNFFLEDAGIDSVSRLLPRYRWCSCRFPPKVAIQRPRCPP